VDDELILCVSKEYLSTKILPKTPRELVELDFITLVGNENKFDGINFIHKDQSIHQHLNGELLFNNKKVIYDTVKAGLGYAVLPKYLVLKELNAGSIVEILPDYKITGASFYALYTQRRKESAQVNHFIDFVEAKINRS
jgi:DNA-binding transcriptional LysR family regulator